VSQTPFGARPRVFSAYSSLLNLNY
jgi:hypothetical protein